MELSFATVELRRRCADPDWAARHHGSAVAASLRRRVADLRAAPNAADLPCRWEPRQGNPLSIVIVLAEDHEMHLSVAHASIPEEGAQVDWTWVHRLRLDRLTVRQA